jgi:hypothetical protein
VSRNKNYCPQVHQKTGNCTGKEWSVADDAGIARIAETIETRDELERVAKEVAGSFGRTSVAVAKRIEKHKGWHYRQDRDR